MTVEELYQLLAFENLQAEVYLREIPEGSLLIMQRIISPLAESLQKDRPCIVLCGVRPEDVRSLPIRNKPNDPQAEG